MICKNCGYQSDKNVTICPHCGENFSFETEENPSSDKSNSNYELRLDNVEIPFNLNKDVEVIL